MKKIKLHNFLSIIIAFSIILIDQIIKLFVKQNLKDSIPIIKNIFHLTLVYNQGAGFGILHGQRIILILFSLIIFAGIIYKWNKIPEKKGISIPLGLLLGGLVGNLIDRILRGYVIDFLDFRIWPVFNLADSAITISVIWLIIILWKN